MRKYDRISNKVKIIGIKRGYGKERKVDYYLIHPKFGREYAFTRKYTIRTYNLVKGGIPVKEVLTSKSHDKTVMLLADYMNLMIPYFIEEIDWIAA